MDILVESVHFCSDTGKLPADIFDKFTFCPAGGQNRVGGIFGNGSIALQFIYNLLNAFGKFSGFFRKFTYFFCHNGKSFSGFSGAGALNGSIQGEQIRLAGDRGDLIRNFLHFFCIVGKICNYLHNFLVGGLRFFGLNLQVIDGLLSAGNSLFRLFRQ